MKRIKPKFPTSRCVDSFSMRSREWTKFHSSGNDLSSQVTKRRPKVGQAFSVCDRVECNWQGNGEFYPGLVWMFFVLFFMCVISPTPKDTVRRCVCCAPPDLRRQRGRHVQCYIRWRQQHWKECQVTVSDDNMPRHHAILRHIGQQNRVKPWSNSWNQLFICATITTTCLQVV